MAEMGRSFTLRHKPTGLQNICHRGATDKIEDKACDAAEGLDVLYQLHGADKGTAKPEADRRQDIRRTGSRLRGPWKRLRFG